MLSDSSSSTVSLIKSSFISSLRLKHLIILVEYPLFISKMKTPVVVDARGIIDLHIATKAGLIFRGIGRGKI